MALRPLEPGCQGRAGAPRSQGLLEQDHLSSVLSEGQTHCPPPSPSASRPGQGHTCPCPPFGTGTSSDTGKYQVPAWRARRWQGEWQFHDSVRGPGRDPCTQGHMTCPPCVRVGTYTAIYVVPVACHTLLWALGGSCKPHTVCALCVTQWVTMEATGL